MRFGHNPYPPEKMGLCSSYRRYLASRSWWRLLHKTAIIERCHDEVWQAGDFHPHGGTVSHRDLLLLMTSVRNPALPTWPLTKTRLRACLTESPGQLLRFDERRSRCGQTRTERNTRMMDDA